MPDDLMDPGTESVDLGLNVDADALDAFIADQSPDADAEPADSPADPLDSDLAKQLNLDALPEDPADLKRAVQKRLHELRDFGRKSGEQAKQEQTAIKAELAEMRTALQQMQRPPAPAGRPADSDEELINQLVDGRVDQRYGGKLRQIDQLQQHMIEQMVESAKARLPDFEQHEEAMAAALTRHPTFTLDDAYRHVTADTAKERAKVELLADLKAKHGTGSLRSAGPSSTSTKEPDPSTTSDTDFWAWSVRSAADELRRKGVLIPHE